MTDKGLPLVSVLCRSMNRPELRDALLSVEQQTYVNIEIVLVDAAGKGLAALPPSRFPVIAVSEGRQLNRPAAANAALQHAKGTYLVFLDEDDWIAPDHISHLVQALENHPQTGVTYSSTQKVTASGAATEETFCVAYDAARLRRDNFIPIHSALFRKSLLAHGIHFDEELAVFEDWDFWLQLAAHTDFLHVDEISAFYRQGGESNTASADASTRYQPGHPIAQGRERVFNKWLKRWTGRELNQTLHSLDESALIQSLHEDIRRLNKELISYDRTINKLNHTVSRKSAELQEAKAHIEHLTAYIDMLQGSLSWRVTRPLRWLRRQLDARRASGPANVLQGSAGSNTSVIQGNLDIPNASENEFSEQLSLQGWCCSPDGIDRIEALVDGVLIKQFSTGISRPDIAELYPDFPDVFSAGFQQELALPELSAGDHTLELRFIDKAERSVSIRRQFSLYKGRDLYNSWYWRNVPGSEQLAAISANNTVLPGIQVLITGIQNEQLLGRTLSSLADQAHKPKAVHLLGSASKTIQELATLYLGQSCQIHWHADLDSAFAQLESDAQWNAVLQAGETVAPHALADFMQAAQTEGTTLIYSDHDTASESDEHSDPVFTPQWSPEHLLSSNYVGGFFAFRHLDKLDWRLLTLTNSAWRYALLLQIADQIEARQVQRIPRVLWSAGADHTPVQLSDEVTVLRAHLARTCADALVLEQEHGIRSVVWPLTSQPKVSIIIPTMGKLELIKPCIDSLLDKTSYPDFEVVILDNGRGKFPEGIQYLKERELKVIECNEPFNWARLNNIGVSHATGSLLLFLNDDIEILSKDWLQHLVRQAQRDDVGTVGALLYYPNGALQHTGVMLVNYGGGGIHLLHKRMPDSNIYRNLHRTTREVSANTGACLMVSRAKFEHIGGFDEELAVVGNDVDFCLRLLDKGYRNIWTPLCYLTHHESISRKTSVPKKDEKAMWQRWSKRFIAGDPYYNPNLSAEKGDFSLRISKPSVIEGRASSAGTAVLAQTQLPGVNLIGYTRAEMGIGEGARSDARALDAANEPFGIISFTSGNPSRMTDLSWQHKEIDSAPYDVSLLHINPDHALQAIAELPSSHFEGHYCIGYWAWELPEIPADWEKAFQYFDEIWVPSSFVQDAVAMKSPVPVVRIPHCIEVQLDSAITRKDFDLPLEPFLFLVMFDTYSRQERKNPYGAIEAFRKAFSPDDMSVRLVIKVNNATADALRELRERAGAHQNIMLLDKVYSRAQVNAMISCCDCFVSLHRSEGFGFGPAEAMALGKATMATNWSGNVDYMRPDNSIGINYELVTIQEDHGPYKQGQVWAEPDIEQAAQAMAQLAGDRQLAQRLGQKARDTINTEFSPLAVGRMMRKRLEAVRQLKSVSDQS